MYTPEAGHAEGYYRPALALASVIERAHSALSPRERAGVRGSTVLGEKPPHPNPLPAGEGT
jgi:hypothetical protein